jgi:ZIP family zinc transporter
MLLMTETQIALSLTLLAGISTGLGAIPILFKERYSTRFRHIALGFSSGVMICASFISLIIPGIEAGSSLNLPYKAGALLVIAGLLLGHIIISYTHDWLPHEHVYKKDDYKGKTKFSSAIMILVAMTLHNFPEGLAVGVGFGGEDMSAGVVIALAITLQNLPEGLIIALSLVTSGVHKKKAFFISFLSGMVEPIGAALGFLMTQVSALMLPTALGLAAGAMIFVVGHELIPEVHKEGHEREATHGLIFGIILILLLDTSFA